MKQFRNLTYISIVTKICQNVLFNFRNTISSILKEHNQIDFLINNGGGQFPSCAKDITLKGWNAVIETNLTGAFLMSKEGKLSDYMIFTLPTCRVA